MRPAVRHATRWATDTASTQPLARRHLSLQPAWPWTCTDCLTQVQRRKAWDRQKPSQRGIRTSTRRLQDDRAKAAQSKRTQPKDDFSSDPLIEDESLNASAKADTLPSYQEQKRGQMSKRMELLMNDLLVKASVASQQINTYTGTDYSGIETLRKEIGEQEQMVREYHQAVQDARKGHTGALSEQAGAQKEIVGLLERKSGWSPGDLERYMSLVRSEHLNDQAVTSAKDHLQVAERDLEQARSLLEKLERKQYHEEQIWSDTIRRNSTWVTFGLMGVNIVLLLAQLVVFEPHRRRKIVREVKAALDEKDFSGLQPETAARIEQAVDLDVTPETLGLASSQEPGHRQSEAVTASTSKEELAEDLPLAGEAVSLDDPTANSTSTPLPAADAPISAPIDTSTWSGLLEAWQEVFLDLFSERLIQLKRVEATTIALEGAATGVAAMSLLFLLLKPR